MHANYQEIYSYDVNNFLSTYKLVGALECDNNLIDNCCFGLSQMFR